MNINISQECTDTLQSGTADTLTTICTNWQYQGTLDLGQINIAIGISFFFIAFIFVIWFFKK